jgi:hypothetical protein
MDSAWKQYKLDAREMPENGDREASRLPKRGEGVRAVLGVLTGARLAD